MDILQSVMDCSSHAMFTMDRQGIVTHINRQAKESFGLFNHSRHAHPAGRLLRGDMVILATTAMGQDDGALTPSELETIGIRDRRIRPGDMIAAVGVYGGEGVKPVCKYLHSGSADELRLDVTFQGVPISVQIDSEQVSVTVREDVYTIGYFMCIGQLVVLDRYTRQVKFWEEKGYSARREGIGSLLRGGGYIAKSPEQEIHVAGYHFRDFFEGALFEEHLQKVLTGEVSSFVDMPYEINGSALSASILPMRDGDGSISGTIVKFRNVEDLKTSIIERNTAIAAAERKYRETERGAVSDVSGEMRSAAGDSAVMRTLHRRAYRLSQMDCSILLTGEPGTGRSALAQDIARVQPRRGPFVKADCSAMLPAALEEALFGSGGLLAAAHGGTLFLDGVDRLQPGAQARLLRCLTAPEEAPDVRLLAAADGDLRTAAEQGRFRQDLYYRLSAFSLELPPLREHKEDIYLLAGSLIEKIRQRYGIPERFLSGEAFSKLMNYDWPGNIREMEKVLESAVVLCDTDIIYPEHIRLDAAPVTLTLRQQLKQAERRILQQTLAQCGGDRQQAMQLLGLSRTVFYEKLKEHGIRRDGGALRRTEKQSGNPENASYFPNNDNNLTN